jgi:hypothetical protein
MALISLTGCQGRMTASPTNFLGVSASNGRPGICRSHLTSDTYYIRNTGCLDGDSFVGFTTEANANNHQAAPDASTAASNRNETALCSLLQQDGPIKTLQVKELLAELRGASLAKGEFEKTADYKIRMTQILQKISSFSEAKTGQRDLTFSFPIPQDSVNYDADSNLLTIGSQYGNTLKTESALSIDKYLVASSEAIKACNCSTRLEQRVA